MSNGTPLSGFPKSEQVKLRWLLRHAASNGIVNAGVAWKFGRSWYVDTDRLPAFLIEKTKAAIGSRA